MYNTWKRSFAVRTALITTFVLLTSSVWMKEAHGSEVEEYVVCKDLLDDLPAYVTDTFAADDEKVVFWANVTDVTIGLKFRWEWCYPNGSLFMPLEIEATQPYEWVGVWGSVSIRDHAPALVLGTWTVKFYMGGVLQATVPFEIVAAGPTVTVVETETSKFTVTETSVMTSTETYTASVTTEITRTDVLTLGAAAGVALIVGLLVGALVTRRRT